MSVIKSSMREIPTFPFSSADKEFMLKNAKGMSVHEINDKLEEKHNPRQIKDFCKNHKIKLRHLSVQEQRRQRLQVNIDFFKTWSPNMAYVFGLWCADGCIMSDERFGIHKFQISLHKNDEDLLEDVITVMGGNPEDIQRFIYPRRNIYNVAFTNTEIYNDIINLGGKERKSNDMHLPHVPDEYFWDFLRGMSDGDGSVDRTGKIWTLTNNKFMCAEIKEKIKEKTGIELKTYGIKNHAHTVLIRTTTWRDWEIIYHKFYDNINDSDNCLFMKRKKRFVPGQNIRPRVEKEERKKIYERILNGEDAEKIRKEEYFFMTESNFYNRLLNHAFEENGGDFELLKKTKRKRYKKRRRANERKI